MVLREFAKLGHTLRHRDFCLRTQPIQSSEQAPIAGNARQLMHARRARSSTHDKVQTELGVARGKSAARLDSKASDTRIYRSSLAVWHLLEDSACPTIALQRIDLRQASTSHKTR